MQPSICPYTSKKSFHHGRSSSSFSGDGSSCMMKHPRFRTTTSGLSMYAFSSCQNGAWDANPDAAHSDGTLTHTQSSAELVG